MIAVTRHRSPAVALLALSVLVLGNLGSLAHLLLVRHARCHEHGELLHAWQGSPATLPARGLERVVQTSEAAAGGHRHEHCAVGAASRRDAVAGQTCLPGARALFQAALSTSHDDCPQAVGRVWMLAPKQSPPA
jgi:hypothetical protein